MRLVALDFLRALRDAHEPFKTVFYQRSNADREAHLRALTSARDTLWTSLLGRCFEESPARSTQHFWAEIAAYTRRSDWVCFDLVSLAACTDAAPELLARQAAPNLLIFQAYRMLDDIVDDHHDFKGAYPTAYGALVEQFENRETALATTVLALTLMATEGISEATADAAELAKLTLSGALSEVLWAIEGDASAYSAIVERKMVAYGMLAYEPLLQFVGPQHRDALELFLRRSFRIAQIVNDLGDVEGDRERHQPNYWLLTADPDGGELRFLGRFEELSASCESLVPRLQPYAHARVADLARYALERAA
jgi:hypothetical protein